MEISVERLVLNMSDTITLAEHQRLVREAVEAERERCRQIASDHSRKLAASGQHEAAFACAALRIAIKATPDPSNLAQYGMSAVSGVDERRDGQGASAGEFEGGAT